MAIYIEIARNVYETLSFIIYSVSDPISSDRKRLSWFILSLIFRFVENKLNLFKLGASLNEFDVKERKIEER